jgi:hypothetical protein
MAIDKKEMWVKFAQAAQSRYMIPEDIDNADELVDDMVEVSVKYADSMLDEFDERFESSGRGRSRRRGKPAEPPETED